MEIKALIYTRVSSKQQVDEGNGLRGQEKICRDYARDILGIEVEKVFQDKWVSWWIFDRKGMKELLDYLNKNKKKNFILIIDDLNRFSRDVWVHHLLRNEFRKRNIEISCPNFKFEETPEWTLMENINVSVSQYEREKNRQRVISRQKARVSEGFWCHHLPVWLKYSTNKKWWKRVLFDETNCYKIKEALEKFSNDELKSVHDFIRFLDWKWVKICPVKKWKVYRSDLAHRMLKNILYAWYVEMPCWDIPRTKWQHKALISLETHEKILRKLWEIKTQSKLIRNIESSENKINRSEEFPLRWFLYCEKTKYRLSWWWSKWRRQRFPYYTFPKQSPMSWKSVNRDVLHNEIEWIIERVKPNDNLIEAFEETLNIAIEKVNKNEMNIISDLRKEIRNIEEQIENYIEKLWSTKSESLTKNYEKKVEELEKEKNKILREIDKAKNITVWTPLKEKMNLVRNSLSIWKSADLENKRKLIKNIFPEWIPINKKKQVWTLTFSQIYQAFEVWKTSKNDMVGLRKLSIFSLKYINKPQTYLSFGFV